MTHHNVIRLFSGTLIAALVLGCGSDQTVDSGPFLEVTAPGYFGLIEGTTQQLAATVDGTAVPVTWSSNNTAVITVSASGLVTAIGAGNAAATATLTSDPTKLRSASFTITSPPLLVSGTAVTAISGTGDRGTQKLYKIVVPTGATSLSITLAGGTGDVDLYMRQGTPPTISSYATTSTTCSSENGGNGESCVVPNPTPGTWFVMLGLWDPYSGVTLTPTVTP